MRRNSTGRNLATLGVMIGIIALLAFVVTLRDYTIQMDGIRPVLVARISIPLPNNVRIKNTEIGKLTVSTASKGKQVGGYEFRISRFENMAFAHSFRSVEPKKEIGKLKPGKRYYAQVRCYKQNQMGRNVFGRWSGTSSAVVKEE